MPRVDHNNIFVFGSNLAGRHGKGAALYAKNYYGAKYGCGDGLTGQSYAIPTKDENLKVLPLSEIEKYVDKFISYATLYHEYNFLVTAFGTGLAGYSIEEIKNLFKGKKLPYNILFMREWIM